MLAFIDESGYARPKDPSPWSTLTAVCIPEAASRDLSRWLHSTVRAIYPAIDPQEIEIKAAHFLSRRQFEHSVERRRLIAEVSGLIEKLPLSVFAVRARRPAAVPNWPSGRVDPPHRLLVERIELHMRRDHPTNFAKLVFDETDVGNDAARSKALRKFMHATSEGKCWTHILDVPFFVSSSITPGIQLADLMAGAIRHYQILRDSMARPSTEWEQAVFRLAKAAEDRTQNFTVSADTYYGLYTMPDRYFISPPGWRPF